MKCIREDKKEVESLVEIWNTLKQNYKEDWLLPLEIAELLNNQETYIGTVNEIVEFLNQYAEGNKEYKTLIINGLNSYIKH